MGRFSYQCPACGEFTADVADDIIFCRCGRGARRNYGCIGIIKSSLKTYGHWDAQVGAYVENEAQFKSLLAQGVEAQANLLGTDVNIATCDLRDNEGIAELHGYTPEQREADLEPVRKAEFERADK